MNRSQIDTIMGKVCEGGGGSVEGERFFLREKVYLYLYLTHLK